MSDDIEESQIEKVMREMPLLGRLGQLNALTDERITYLQKKTIQEERTEKSTLFMGLNDEELFVVELDVRGSYVVRSARTGDYRRHNEDGFLDLNGKMYPLDELDEENLSKIK